MKEFLRLEKHITAVDGEGSVGLTLTRGDLAHRQISILIDGVAKANIANVVALNVKAGASSVNLAYCTDIISASGTAACIVRIDFPVHYLQVTLTPSGTDLNVTIYGGNK